MIELNTFTLEEFDKTNFDHRYVAKVLNNDIPVRIYISPDFENFIGFLQDKGKFLNDEFVNVYVAYLKQKGRDNIPVGIVACDIGLTYQIDYALLPDKRGENLATMLLQQYAYYLVDERKLDQVTCIINSSNLPSVKTAISVGFEKKNECAYTLKKSR